MGFFFRRSATLGPFRLNFSKSGIGASVGVKGARLTTTPRGTTYITVGGHGFYYRETLSNRKQDSVQGAPAVPPVAPSAPARPSDEIVTAAVSDLVDSSTEILIQRLNERAKMFNPAWLVYALAAAMIFSALAMFSSAFDVALPDVSSPLSTERTSNTIDDYATLVTRYGYPDTVLATEPLGVVPVRTATYASVDTKILLVPNGCAGVYEETTRTLAENLRYPALAKGQPTNKTRCITSSSNGWTIVAYLDSFENRRLSVDSAKTRLDNISSRQVAPPIVEPESVPTKAQKPLSRGLPKKALQ